MLLDWGFLWCMAGGHLLDGLCHFASTSRSKEFGSQHFSDELHTFMGVFYLTWSSNFYSLEVSRANYRDLAATMDFLPKCCIFHASLVCLEFDICFFYFWGRNGRRGIVLFVVNSVQTIATCELTGMADILYYCSLCQHMDHGGLQVRYSSFWNYLAVDVVSLLILFLLQFARWKENTTSILVCKPKKSLNVVQNCFYENHL